MRAPYDQYVTPNTRFWQASGIDVSLSASGLSVQTQSLLSILIGGIAFETPPRPCRSCSRRPSQDASSRCTATGPRPSSRRRSKPQTYELIFNESVRGLTRGAPVEFRGIPVGEVTDDSRANRPEDLQVLGAGDYSPGSAATRGQGAGHVLRRGSGDHAAQADRLAGGPRGPRAAATGNLLTGAVFVALDFFPDAPPATVDWSQTPVQSADHSGTARGDRGERRTSSRSSTRCRSRQIGDDLQKAARRPRS